MLTRIAAIQGQIDGAALGIADALLSQGADEDIEARQVIAFAESPASLDWHLRETLRRLQQAAGLACTAYQLAGRNRRRDAERETVSAS